MIVSVTIPYNARYRKEGGTHLWFFYKQLQDFSAYLEHVTFIGWEKNFIAPGKLQPGSWESSADIRQKLEFVLPDKELLGRAQIVAVDQKMFAPLEERLKSNRLSGTSRARRICIRGSESAFVSQSPIGTLSATCTKPIPKTGMTE